MRAEMRGEMNSMQEEMEKTQEERNSILIETTKEMINDNSAATNKAMDKAVKDQGAMMQNMMIMERSRTDSKFDQSSIFFKHSYNNKHKDIPPH
eukprot:5314952-Ditylum_brightwellii.AAC.1